MNDLGTKEIETERLRLRRFRIEDAKEMFENWGADPKTTFYLSWEPNKSVEAVQELLKHWIQEYEHNSYNWVVECKETGHLIGNISCVKVNRKDHCVEIGYCYGSKFWGHGYATEALKAVISYLLKDCEFHLVEAKHHSRNIASGRVMQKAGMQKDSVLKDRKYNAEDNSYSDLIVYSSTSETFTTR